MKRAVSIIAGALLFAAGGAASAQELAAYQPNACQKFSSDPSERETVYLRAACVAARAGIASPSEGELSRDELLSILMLMSLRQDHATHRS